MNSLLLNMSSTCEPTSPKALSPAHIVPGKNGLEVVLGLDAQAWNVPTRNVQSPVANVATDTNQAWSLCRDVAQGPTPRYNFATYANEEPLHPMSNRADTDDVQKISGAWQSLQQKKLQAVRDMYQDESPLHSQASETTSAGEDEAAAPGTPTTRLSSKENECALEQSMDTLRKWDVAEDMPTLMMRHIPTRATQQEILESIDDLGFTSELDFFYLPLKKGQMRNCGYAFIGLRSMEATARFTAAIVGYRFPKRQSERAIEVLPARIQGFGANAGRSRRARNNSRLVNSPFLYGRAAPLRTQTSSP